MAPRSAVTFALAVLLCASVAAGQTASPAEVRTTEQVAQFDTPAYVASVDGTATLERDGRAERAPLNMPLLSGDRLKTAAGRVEVRFSDGGRLFLDNQSTIDVMSDSARKPLSSASGSLHRKMTPPGGQSQSSPSLH